MIFLNTVYCHVLQDRFLDTFYFGFILCVSVIDMCEPAVQVMTFLPHVASEIHILKL